MTNFNLTEEQRQELLSKLGALMKDKVSLEQNLREEKNQAIADSESLFLELLEVVDSLDFLLDYLADNPELNPKFIQRLPRNLETIQKKLLTVLKKRTVNEIEYGGSKPDFNFCRVIDCEINHDFPEGTITKIVRRGFYFGEKVLRPIEVITSKTE
jgi:molecular chaperone GrpE